MRILVTGATSAMLHRSVLTLTEHGHEVVCFQRNRADLDAEQLLGDLRDRDAVIAAAVRCDVIIHGAAKVGVVGAETEFRAVNVDGTSNVIAAARRHGVGGVVMVSSPSVAHRGAPVVGDGGEPAELDHHGAHYPETKAEAELLALAAADASLGVVAIRPHLVWGPRDRQLVGRIVDRARAGRLAIIGSGSALIDSTYIDNAADALVRAAEIITPAAVVSGRPYVIANGEPRPVSELMARICAAAGVEFAPRHVPRPVALLAGRAIERAYRGRDSEPPLTRFVAEQLSTAHWFDPRPARRDLDWNPAISLDEGFVRLTDWFNAERR